MFSDPIAQVIIVNPSLGADKAWKWTAPDFPFLTGVSLFWEMKKTGDISITIDAPYSDGIEKILTPPTPFAIGNYIQARIGYATGEFTPWAVGVLNAGGAGISVDPNGVSGTVTFAGMNASAFYTVSKEIMALTDYKKMLEVCSAYLGLKLKLSPTVEDILTEMNKAPVERTAFANLNSWEFVKKICEYGNFTFAAANGWLMIMAPREERKLTPPDKYNNYVMRGVIDVANRQYPLLTWTPEGSEFATWLAEHPNPAAAGIESIYCDSKSGKVDWVQVLPKDVQAAITGIWPTSPPESLTAGDFEMDKARAKELAAEIAGQPVKSGEDGKKQAAQKNETEIMTGNPAQVGVISTIGVPSEFPNNFSNVRGLGAVYDGLYQVRKVVHTWGAGTYDMSLTVFRFGAKEKAMGAQEETAGGQE